MGKPQLWRWSLAWALGLGLYGFVSGPAFAAQAQYPVKLQGSGPVYTAAVRPQRLRHHGVGLQQQQPECRL